MNEILDIITESTRMFVECMPKSQRKQYGQFFTTAHTANFMSTLYGNDCNKESVKILDAGAGAGILSASLVSHLRETGFGGKIHLRCYETDTNILPLLAKHLNLLKTGYDITYEIVTDNYITSQSFASNDIFAANNEEFDYVIGNPPYKKISKDALEALHMRELCHGAPNLYFLFWAMGIKNLKHGGELVYIIPRSWTSGAYFEKFRKFLFRYCSIEHVHLFGSREKVFKGESVLQETMIVKVRKTTTKPKRVSVSFSETSDFSDVTLTDMDYDVIVGANGYIYLVTSKEEAEVLSRLNSLDTTLVSENLKMKTGIIVDFRTRDVLRNEEGELTYPLFFSQHIKNGTVVWPVGKENEYICTERAGYLQENTNYLFVKRFTAKEEKRRLQCGIYFANNYPQYKYISTQNKINFIKCDSEEEAYGLYVLLNSTLYDSYYRILNGSTQVNSTEINNMPVPRKDIIIEMGKELRGQELTEYNCNKIIDRWIK